MSISVGRQATYTHDLSSKQPALLKSMLKQVIVWVRILQQDMSAHLPLLQHIELTSAQVYRLPYHQWDDHYEHDTIEHKLWCSPPRSWSCSTRFWRIRYGHINGKTKDPPTRRASNGCLVRLKMRTCMCGRIVERYELHSRSVLIAVYVGGHVDNCVADVHKLKSIRVYIAGSVAWRRALLPTVVPGLL